MAREVKNDRQEFSRLLSSYASLINENNDLPRLKALAVDLKDRFVCVGLEGNGAVPVHSCTRSEGECSLR